jgi:hypothetical protein
MAGAPDIYDDIIDTLENNGEMETIHYRRLILYALLDLGRGRKDIAEISVKVKTLERNSILLIAKKHPKISLSISGFFAVFIILVIVRLDLWTWLAAAIGFPLP